MEGTSWRSNGGVETPERATEATASTGGGRTVAYREYGAPDGTPVVFLHGTPGSRRLGALFHGAARRSGVRLLAVDRPGYGRSTPWPARTLADTGAFVSSVLDDAGVSRAGVVGFSGGGPHALALAATHGERVRRVDVVAGAVPPSLEGRTPTARHLLGAAAERAPRVLKGVLRGQAWVVRYAPPAVVVSQYTTASGREHLDGRIASLVADDFVEALSDSRSGAATEFRLLADEWDLPLDRIERRVRWWHGERDTNVPLKGARRVCGRLPTAELTVVEDADHLSTLVGCRSAVCERQRGNETAP